MPTMEDPRFERSVIYICTHNEEGAMGLVVNDPLPDIGFEELLKQLDIDVVSPIAEKSIYRGGPVEGGRGFVLHSADYVNESTMVVSETLALTATVDILKAIANGAGPKNCMIALGYSGWGPGQLEDEIRRNSWMNVRADDEIMFHTEAEDKWPRAMGMLGINLSMLSNDTGNA